MVHVAIEQQAALALQGVVAAKVDVLPDSVHCILVLPHAVYEHAVHEHHHRLQQRWMTWTAYVRACRRRPRGWMPCGQRSPACRRSVTL